MRKLLLVLLSLLLFNIKIYAEQKKENKDILLLEINKIFQKGEYYIKNNELYFPICIWESIEERKKSGEGKSKVYKYKDKKLI